MNILCTAPVLEFDKTVQFLKSKANTTFLEYPRYEDVLKIIHKFDGLMPNARMPIDAQLLKNAHRLTTIYQPSLGRDHIDEEECRKKKIQVTGLSDDRQFRAALWSTAEFTVGLILLILKKYRESANAVTESGCWRNTDFIGSDLRGKVVGILGYGNIGSKVDSLLTPFGVKSLKCDPYIEQLDSSYVNLEDLFRLSDIVTLHVPLTKETNGMISMEYFSLMKSGYLINASRGPVIIDNDLISAMEGGYIHSAALDVINNESPHGVQGHPLIDYSKVNPRLTITPHIGGSSFEYLNSIFLHSAKELVRLLTEKI
jgi:D-3-phosphoglycerate dehydrogenase / 2-oxoglutarate reductase